MLRMPLSSSSSMAVVGVNEEDFCGEVLFLGPTGLDTRFNVVSCHLVLVMHQLIGAL